MKNRLFVPVASELNSTRYTLLFVGKKFVEISGAMQLRVKYDFYCMSKCHEIEVAICSLDKL